jgi:phosphonate transport system substrate-binding protein
MKIGSEKHIFNQTGVSFIKILPSVLILLILGMGCSDSSKDQTPKSKRQGATFTVGLIPEHNIFKQIDRYEPLMNYLSEKTGLNIKTKALTRYGNIIDNFVSAGLDAAFFGSFTYTLAHAKLGVEPIARPESVDGTSTYHGLIFVRVDSGIKKAEDMRGKIFVFVDRATTAGYLLPLAYFKKNGIEDFHTFLKETYFAGAHENAIYDVLNKKADIGAAKNTVFERLVSEDGRIRNELVLIARSPDVPENGLAVRKGLDKHIKQELKETLLNMEKDPEGIEVLTDFGAKRFIETKNEDYISVYKYVKEAGLDLAAYQYYNK